LGIFDSDSKIPNRVDEARKGEPKSLVKDIRGALARVARAAPVRSDATLRVQVEDVSQLVSDALNRSEESLRLYAQLASTGIAATSFSHELRSDFDVVSEAISEITTSRRKPDSELLDLLNTSWARIRSFASLFKVVPVKIRRHRKVVSGADLRASADAILGLAPPDKVSAELKIPSMKLSVVPAEVDSILLNLVSNAVKAIAESHNREAGVIRVQYATQGNDFVLRVADNGSGVSPKVREIMFEPLEGRFAEGTGMGLPIVKYIAERYHGHVDVVQAPSAKLSTELVVTLRGVVC
jgi:signal transduction histidine kinase